MLLGVGCAFRVNRYEITYRFACVQIDRLEGGEEDDFGIVVRNEITSWNKFREKVCRNGSKQEKERERQKRKERKKKKKNKGNDEATVMPI